MRVLLTGASGFLGRHVLDSLRRQGIETVMLGRRRATDSDFADFIEADLLSTQDPAEWIRQARASHLLHLAWFAEHGEYWTSPLNQRWVEATTRLVEAFCAGGGQQVVAAGTCAEYDWSEGYCREEGTALNPATVYGKSKDAARRLAMDVCARHQLPCAWGRVFIPFGAGENVQRLIPSLIAAFRGTRAAFGVNARAYRDFLHASDVAAGFLALLHSGASGAYNISSGQPVQLCDLVCELARLLEADPQPVLELAGERSGEPLLLVGENLKLRTLGWTPALSLEQGLQQTLSDLRP